ncbi:MAG TPA: phosphoadenylyl-sulfate reductase [bacterium]
MTAPAASGTVVPGGRQREELLAELRAAASARELLARAAALLHPRLALATAFGRESIVLVSMLAEVFPGARIFAIDTGRLPEETYEVAERVRERFGVAIEWHFPERASVEEQERRQGLFSFRRGLEARRECCRIRKVEPLGRALAGLDGWISGRRASQGVTRSRVEAVALDEAHGGLIKLDPLAGWTAGEVAEYIRAHDLPYNRLHDQGYPSVGCAPCTRPVQAGDDERAGRWWWERPEHKECGLHLPSQLHGSGI